MEEQALKVVTNVINDWDPMDLNGAPGDEYEYEISLITKVVFDSRDELDIAEGIKDTMDYCFQCDIDFERCLVAAKKIWLDLYE